MGPETLERVSTWSSRKTWGSARWQQGLAAVLAVVIFWPPSPVNAQVGLDPSWGAGLALARIHNLAWGSELVFTFGPLGVLNNTAYYSFGQSVFATVYQAIVVAALYLGIAAALRQRHAPMTSLISAFVITGIAVILQGFLYPELTVLAALAWASVPLLQQDPKRSTAFITSVVLGAVAGFQLLMKFNTGIIILGIALAMSVLLDWRAVGRHCATAAAFAVSGLSWWMLAGQRLGDLPGWLGSSATVVSGWSGGMAIPFEALAVPAIVLGLAWVAALCAILVRGGPETPRKLVLLIGLVTLVTGKYVFTRLDPNHFYVLLALIVVAVGITPLYGTGHRVRPATAVAIALSFALLGAMGIAQEGPVQVVTAPARAVDRVYTLALPGRVGQEIEEAKAQQREFYAVPDRFVDTIASGSVHLDPIETSAVWAYDLAWHPVPVFQSNLAYSPMLDHLNSDSLTDGPEFVLSHVSPDSPATGIDRRLGVQESPLYSRALLCNYAVSGVDAHWALYARASDRCGPLTALSEVEVYENDVVEVPAPSAPDMAVLVGVDLDRTVVDRLFQGVVAPLTASTVVLDGVAYRLVTANAAEPFLVSTPASVSGTNLEIAAHSIGVGRIGALGPGNVAARLRFFEMRVQP
jgi:hypothetical protein